MKALHRHLGPPLALVLTILALGQPVSGQALDCADVDVPPCGWPTEPRSSYDPATQILNVTWSPPMGVEAGDVDEYRVYRDGTLAEAVTTQYWTENLSTWTTTQHHKYEVSAVVDGVEGGKTPPLLVGRLVAPGLGGGCSLIGITVYNNPPGVAYQIFWECL